MKLLLEINDTDLGLKSNKQYDTYAVRKAARAVVFNQNNQIALLFVSKHNYYKLPGGGVEEDESLTKALTREIKEEVGVEVSILSDVGKIIEYRDKHELIQESYCYITKLDKLLGNLSLTEDELSDGFILKWVMLDEAITLINKEKPKDYTGLFIQLRDYTFLTEAIEILK